MTMNVGQTAAGGPTAKKRGMGRTRQATVATAAVSANWRDRIA